MSRIAELHAGLRPQLEVVVTRVFDASAELVFRMWTEPEHFARWWGPKGFTNPVCELDARPGGAILVHMRAPNGAVYPLAGTFREIVPCERLVFTFIAEDGEGNAALDEITTVTFAAEGSKTRVTVRSKACGPRAGGALPCSPAWRRAGRRAWIGWLPASSPRLRMARWSARTKPRSARCWPIAPGRCTTRMLLLPWPTSPRMR